MIVPIIVSISSFLIYAAIFVGLSFVLYKFACKLIDKNPFLALVVSAFGIFLFPIGIVVPVLVFTKIGKMAGKKTQEQFAVMSELAKDPTDAKVDAFMALVDGEGGVIGDNPNNWNAFRNLWFAINESPNVTTQKKNIFCMWLSGKGLILSAKQAQVKDNYKG